MIILLAGFGVLSVMALAFCACLGIAASRADRAADNALRAHGVTIASQAEILATMVNSSSAQGASGITVPVH